MSVLRVCCIAYSFFFFKQKTAYELRISDWSSDVCSSDLDGQDIRTVQQQSIRQQLGIVLQNTFLFSGTIMENIRYGRLDASEAEVVAAAKLANADQDRKSVG